MAFFDESFRGFSQATIPRDASEQQFYDMRNAFFAGAWACFESTMAASDLPEDRAEAVLDAFHDELKKWKAEMVLKAKAQS